MAGKLSAHPPNDSSVVRDSSTEWTVLTDRGGLYHIEDNICYLFVALELASSSVLDGILQSKGKRIDKVKKENLAWLCDDEEVQFLWNVVVMDDDETAAVIGQTLLQEIAYKWVTTRGYSKVRKLKENYKTQKKQVLKGKHSLRRELASNSDNQELVEE